MPKKKKADNKLVQKIVARLRFAGFDIHPHFKASLQEKSLPVRLNPAPGTISHLIGAHVGKTSFEFAAALFLYCFWPGQDIAWYEFMQVFLSSREVMSSLRQIADVPNTTISDFCWSFDDHAWMYRPQQLRTLLSLFFHIAPLASDLADAAGITTDWDLLTSPLDIWTRTLSVISDHYPLDPSIFDWDVFEIRLRMPAGDMPVSIFGDIRSTYGNETRDALQSTLLDFLRSEYFHWDLPWIYAPRALAYIPRNEWLRLKWLGGLLVRKWAEDAIKALTAKPVADSFMLSTLVTVLTSKETLATLLDIKGYYAGYRFHQSPTLERARSHFLVLLALSLLSFIDRDFLTFTEWSSETLSGPVGVLETKYYEIIDQQEISGLQLPRISQSPEPPKENGASDDPLASLRDYPSSSNVTSLPHAFPSSISVSSVEPRNNQLPERTLDFYSYQGLFGFLDDCATADDNGLARRKLVRRRSESDMDIYRRMAAFSSQEPEEALPPSGNCKIGFARVKTGGISSQGRKQASGGNNSTFYSFRLFQWLWKWICRVWHSVKATGYFIWDEIILHIFGGIDYAERKHFEALQAQGRRNPQTTNELIAPTLGWGETLANLNPDSIAGPTPVPWAAIPPHHGEQGHGNGDEVDARSWWKKVIDKVLDVYFLRDILVLAFVIYNCWDMHHTRVGAECVGPQGQWVC